MQDHSPDETRPDDYQDDTSETINREQADDNQAQDVAEDARGDAYRLGDSSRAPGNIGQVIADDVPDLVDTMRAMVTSGHIDNGAYAGEPMHDDEEDLLGNTEDVDEDDALFNPLADGSEDPLAEVASDHGLEDGTEAPGDSGMNDPDDEDDDDDMDEDDEVIPLDTPRRGGSDVEQPEDYPRI